MKRYDVMYPSEYKDGSGNTKTRFSKVGTAFPLRERDGFSLELHVPISRPRKLVCFVFEPRDRDESDVGDADDPERW